MGEFLGANAFLLAVVLIGAGLFFVFGNLVRALGLPSDYEVYAWCVAIPATLISTYYVTQWLYAMLQRQFNKRGRS